MVDRIHKVIEVRTNATARPSAVAFLVAAYILYWPNSPASLAIKAHFARVLVRPTHSVVK